MTTTVMVNVMDLTKSVMEVTEITIEWIIFDRGGLVARKFRVNSSLTFLHPCELSAK